MFGRLSVMWEFEFVFHRAIVWTDPSGVLDNVDQLILIQAICIRCFVFIMLCNYFAKVFSGDTAFWISPKVIKSARRKIIWGVFFMYFHSYERYPAKKYPIDETKELNRLFHNIKNFLVISINKIYKTTNVCVCLDSLLCIFTLVSPGRRPPEVLSRHAPEQPALRTENDII